MLGINFLIRLKSFYYRSKFYQQKTSRNTLHWLREQKYITIIRWDGVSETFLVLPTQFRKIGRLIKTKKGIFNV